MKTDKKNKPRRYHASLKSRNGGLSPAKRLVLKAFLIPVVFATAAYAVFVCCYKAYSKLLDIRNSQSVVIDEDEQIEINASPHFSKANIMESFGLRKGCNLSEIDFREKRAKILKKRPLLKNITVTRILPKKLIVSVEERKPVARVNYTKKPGEREGWLVVDSEGIVFDYSLNDSNFLPVITEHRPSAAKGDRISGKAMMGLRFVELCAAKAVSNINLTEVDVSNDIYLVAQTREYNKIKLLWSYIRENGDHDTGNMRDALSKIRDIINADLKTGHYQTFIVTGKSRVTVSPHEKEYTR